jgi:hypothetical protein
MISFLIFFLSGVIKISGSISFFLGSFDKGFLVSNHKTSFLLATIMIDFFYFFVLETGFMNEAMATDSPRRPSRCTGGVVVRPQAVT